MFDLKETLSVSLILFSVIDILGALPIIIDLRRKAGRIQSETATLVAGLIMVIFLFVGEGILHLFGIDVSSFAIAGAFILFLMGAEMVLGVHIFKNDVNPESSSIMPLAFPLIAGAGTMTTIITLKAAYQTANILLGIFINLVFVYLVLRSSGWISKILGQAGADILRKVFGLILLAIAVKLFKSNWNF